MEAERRYIGQNDLQRNMESLPTADLRKAAYDSIPQWMRRCDADSTGAVLMAFLDKMLKITLPHVPALERQFSPAPMGHGTRVEVGELEYTLGWFYVYFDVEQLPIRALYDNWLNPAALAFSKLLRSKTGRIKKIICRPNDRLAIYAYPDVLWYKTHEHIVNGLCVRTTVFQTHGNDRLKFSFDGLFGEVPQCDTT